MRPEQRRGAPPRNRQKEVGFEIEEEKKGLKLRRVKGGKKREETKEWGGFDNSGTKLVGRGGAKGRTIRGGKEGGEVFCRCSLSDA